MLHLFSPLAQCFTSLHLPPPSFTRVVGGTTSPGARGSEIADRTVAVPAAGCCGRPSSTRSWSCSVWSLPARTRTGTRRPSSCWSRRCAVRCSRLGWSNAFQYHRAEPLGCNTARCSQFGWSHPLSVAGALFAVLDSGGVARFSVHCSSRARSCAAIGWSHLFSAASHWSTPAGLRLHDRL